MAVDNVVSTNLSQGAGAIDPATGRPTKAAAGGFSLDQGAGNTRNEGGNSAAIAKAQENKEKVDEFMKQYPKGMAMEMCKDEEKHNKKMKEIRKEYERNG